MQPCSQPWYGLIDCVNGMSGESFRAMIVRAFWIDTVVLSGGGSSSLGVPSGGVQPSSTASRASRRKRLAGLKVAPRPLWACGGMAAIERVLAVVLTHELGVHRNVGVEHTRYRTVGLGVSGDLGELRRIDLGYPRSRRQVNRGDRPVAVDLIHRQRGLGVDRVRREACVVEHERESHREAACVCRRDQLFAIGSLAVAEAGDE